MIRKEKTPEIDFVTDSQLLKQHLNNAMLSTHTKAGVSCVSSTEFSHFLIEGLSYPRLHWRFCSWVFHPHEQSRFLLHSPGLCCLATSAWYGRNKETSALSNERCTSFYRINETWCLRPMRRNLSKKNGKKKHLPFEDITRTLRKRKSGWTDHATQRRWCLNTSEIVFKLETKGQVAWRTCLLSRLDLLSIYETSGGWRLLDASCDWRWCWSSWCHSRSCSSNAAKRGKRSMTIIEHVSKTTKSSETKGRKGTEGREEGILMSPLNCGCRTGMITSMRGMMSTRRWVMSSVSRTTRGMMKMMMSMRMMNLRSAKEVGKRIWAKELSEDFLWVFENKVESKVKGIVIKQIMSSRSWLMMSITSVTSRVSWRSSQTILSISIIDLSLVFCCCWHDDRKEKQTGYACHSMIDKRVEWEITNSFSFGNQL